MVFKGYMPLLEKIFHVQKIFLGSGHHRFFAITLLQNTLPNAFNGLAVFFRFWFYYIATIHFALCTTNNQIIL